MKMSTDSVLTWLDQDLSNHAFALALGALALMAWCDAVVFARPGRARCNHPRKDGKGRCAHPAPQPGGQCAAGHGDWRGGRLAVAVLAAVAAVVLLVGHPLPPVS